jgi:uncharacterized protein (TIGR03435 family)
VGSFASATIKRPKFALVKQIFSESAGRFQSGLEAGVTSSNSSWRRFLIVPIQRAKIAGRGPGVRGPQLCGTLFDVSLLFQGLGHLSVESCQGRWMMSVFCRPVAYMLLALPAVAPSQTFATITIKPVGSADPRSPRVQVLPNGDLIASAVPVIALLSYAYDAPVNPSPRLSPLPDWTMREKYDIEAKAPANAIPPGLQQSDVRSRVQRMIRGLLAERFRLVMRVENQTVPVYALTVANGGPKLQKSAIPEKDCTFDTGPDACHNFVGGLGHPLNAKAINMDDLVHYIANWTDLPVVNHTALSGLFTVNTEGWLPMRLPPPPPNTTRDVNHFVGLPTILTVLGKLGLELNRQEDILPVYTVERIERPAAN